METFLILPERVSHSFACADAIFGYFVLIVLITLHFNNWYMSLSALLYSRPLKDKDNV